MDLQQFISAIQQMEGLSPLMKERLTKIAGSLPAEKRREIAETLSPLEKQLMTYERERGHLEKSATSDLQAIEADAKRLVHTREVASAEAKIKNS